MRRRIFFSLCFAVIGVMASSCGKPEPKEAPSGMMSKRYELRGMVISVNAEEKEAVIDHEAIEGFMDAMRMGFTVPEAVDLEKLKPGERIKATLVVENSMMWVEGVEAMGEPGAAPAR